VLWKELEQLVAILADGAKSGFGLDVFTPHPPFCIF
jgi:phosphoglycerate dehydrogenase-like enzyme